MEKTEKAAKKWMKNRPDPLRRSARLCVFVCLGGWGPEQGKRIVKKIFFFFVSSVYQACTCVRECMSVSCGECFSGGKAKKGAGRVRKIFARPEC